MFQEVNLPFRKSYEQCDNLLGALIILLLHNKSYTHIFFNTVEIKYKIMIIYSSITSKKRNVELKMTINSIYLQMSRRRHAWNEKSPKESHLEKKEKKSTTVIVVRLKNISFVNIELYTNSERISHTNYDLPYQYIYF